LVWIGFRLGWLIRLVSPIGLDWVPIGLVDKVGVPDWVRLGWLVSPIGLHWVGVPDWVASGCFPLPEGDTNVLFHDCSLEIQ